MFLVNLYVSLRNREPAGNDPWEGQTLEWATTSPPPRYNFRSLPKITSYAPVLDRRIAKARREHGRRRMRIGALWMGGLAVWMGRCRCCCGCGRATSSLRRCSPAPRSRSA